MWDVRLAIVGDDGSERARLAGEWARRLASATGIELAVIGVAESEDVIVDCAVAGVSGHVPREAGLDELIAVVEAVMRDALVCSPRLAGTLAAPRRRARARANRERRRPPHLTSDGHRTPK